MNIKELIEKVEIETWKGVKVILRKELSWFDYLEAQKIKDDDERGIFTISKLVESWEITNDEGDPLPITEESIRNLPTPIMLPIIEKVNELVKEKYEKKKI